MPEVIDFSLGGLPVGTSTITQGSAPKAGEHLSKGVHGDFADANGNGECRRISLQIGR